MNSKKYGMKPFRFEAAQVWNSLPNEIKLAENYKQFKRLLQAWDGVNCRYHALVNLWFFGLFLTKFLLSAVKLQSSYSFLRFDT